MSADTLVFDMSSQSEGQPSVFVRKDWLSILDNQNQNYQGNQSVIDTSQLANSNKYMNYREAYLTIPLMITCTGASTAVDSAGLNLYFQPANSGASVDYAIGLKNWYGSIIHSFTLDYNGTTIIQQTPYIGLWNTFKLCTTLSYNDLVSSGSQLGFWPDTASSVGYVSASSSTANAGAFNNINGFSPVQTSGNFSTLGSGYNEGLLRRQMAWNFNPNGQSGVSIVPNTFALTNLLPTTALNQLWKSYIFYTANQTTGSGGAAPTGTWQVAITSAVYLKHIASFFERVPLLKGVFLKATINFNQTTTSFTTNALTNQTLTAANITIAAGASVGILSGLTTAAGAANNIKIGEYFTATVGGQASITLVFVEPANDGQTEWVVRTSANITNVQAATALSNFTAIVNAQSQFLYATTNVVSPLGGVNPLMLASMNQGQYAGQFDSGAATAFPTGSYVVSLNVGNKSLNSSQTTATGSPLSGSVILNVPAYSFNPVFESSYLSSPIKKVVYTDVYQYQIVNQIKPLSNFNNLISNGIANIKSVLCLPFYSSTQSTTYVPSTMSVIPIQSPFDPAGAGPTSPLCMLTQFNIQISGQNAIYNTERYVYEQYLNQVYGVNAVNGGQTEGMTSGLIDQKSFETCYNYYYVDCGRMLPVEEAVPKSVSILGQSTSALNVDLFIFVEYGVEVSLDILTGARV